MVNRTDQPLYVTLLHFSQQYGIDQVYTDRVPNGPPVTLWGDAATTGFWLSNGENTALERFKLVVSTEPVDSYLLEQKGLDIGAVLEPTRGFGAFDAPQADKLFAKEWFTKDFRVRVVRRLGGVGASEVSLAETQIRILPHPTVTADVRLGAARQATRGEADASDFYRSLERTGLQLIDFSRAYGDPQRSTEPFNDLSILEFSDIRNADALAQTPLRIEIRTPLGPDEAIVPLVFDGTHVQVAGLFGPQDDGSTLVEIERLPAAEVTQRGLGGTLKLYLFKALLKQADVNRLQWVDFGDASKPPVLSDAMMGAKTGPAKTVLLLLHGLVDSSSDMIAGIQATGIAAEFDLVLVYTYESLKTLIEDTSGKLQAALAGAGIGPNDGKRLTVLAHGMGGLVARHFVELGEGKDVVDHLVMCGTPNQGSPFGEVDAARKLLTFMLTLAQNYIPGAGAYLLPVLTVLKASADMTQTLAEMKPDSALLKALSKAPDPGVSYTILAGNIDAYQEPSDAHFPDLLNRLGKAELFKLLFADKQNDLAASVDSIGGGRKRIDVACYYLNYFTSPAGREALKAVDW